MDHDVKAIVILTENNEVYPLIDSQSFTFFAMFIVCFCFLFNQQSLPCFLLSIVDGVLVINMIYMIYIATLQIKS